MGILCGQYDSLPVTAGGPPAYLLANNAWGYGTAYNGEQCITNASGAPDFTIVKSAADSSAVMGYPSISSGCSLFGNAKTHGSFMPVSLAGLRPILTTWETSQDAVPGSRWDTTYDCWIFSKWPGQQFRVAEVMIMLTYPRVPLGAYPVTVGADEFLLSKRPRMSANDPSVSWNLIQFRYATPRASVTDLNLTPFFELAVTQGWARPADLLVQISAGFELWVNGEGLATTQFSVR
jgi:hypothetical protein